MNQTVLSKIVSFVGPYKSAVSILNEFSRKNSGVELGFNKTRIALFTSIRLGSPSP